MRRRGVSLTEAAKQMHTTSKSMRKYVPRALRRGTDGRYHPTPYDRYGRTMFILTTTGRQNVTIADSRTASRIAEHWLAVDHFLKTGKTDRLRFFRHKSFRAGKVGYPFLTDPRTLARLGSAGEVSFEDLYTLKG